MTSIDLTPPVVHPLDLPPVMTTTAIQATLSTASQTGPNECLDMALHRRKKPGPKPKTRSLSFKAKGRGGVQKSPRNVGIQLLPWLPAITMGTDQKIPPSASFNPALTSIQKPEDSNNLTSPQNPPVSSWDLLGGPPAALPPPQPVSQGVTIPPISTTQFLFSNTALPATNPYSIEQAVQSANSIFKCLIQPSIPQTMTFSNSTANPNSNGHVLTFAFENVTLNLEEMIYSQILQNQFNNRFVEYMNSFPSNSITTLELHQALVNVLNSMSFY